MNTRQPFIIMSAHLSSLSADENAQRAIAMEQWLQAKGYPFKPVTGVYKGTHELSFVVPFVSPDDFDALYSLAIRAYGQESILYVDANGYATLISRDKETGLGMFRNVPEHVAKELDGYTFDPSEGSYYVAG